MRAAGIFGGWSLLAGLGAFLFPKPEQPFLTVLPPRMKVRRGNIHNPMGTTKSPYKRHRRV